MVLAYVRTYEVPAIITRCTNNLATKPVPREVHTTSGNEPYRRQACTRLRRRHAGAGLATRGRPLPGD